MMALVCDKMLKDAEFDAEVVSKDERCVQHVNAILDCGEIIGYSVSDWMDGSTVASYENGRKIG